jgi:hypothetical protein
VDLRVFSTAANITGTPIFQFGLCSGTTNIPGDATPTNAIGCRNTAATWNKVAPFGFSEYGGIDMGAFKNVGGVETGGASITGAAAFLFCNDYTDPTVVNPLFIDITKGSPNYSLNMFYANNSFVAMTSAQYVTQSLATIPTDANCAYSGAVTLAFDQTAGTLDSVFFYFNQASGIWVRDWRAILIS